VTGPSADAPQEMSDVDVAGREAAPGPPDGAGDDRPPTDETVLIDDILGDGSPGTDDALGTGPAQNGPSAPELQRWPGERVFDEDGDDRELPPDEFDKPLEKEDLSPQPMRPQPERSTPEVTDDQSPDPHSPAPKHPAKGPDDRSVPGADRPVEEDPFIDIRDLDVGVNFDSATADKNIAQDKSLRRMGWDDYGERLKKRNQPRKKKKD
jgi:hypothetical protein